MEDITEGVNNINIVDSHKKNRIQVSNTKKPLFFYVNLAKVFLYQFVCLFFLVSSFLSLVESEHVLTLRHNVGLNQVHCFRNPGSQVFKAVTGNLIYILP